MAADEDDAACVLESVGATEPNVRAAAPSVVSLVRRPYRAPTIRFLGSVRDLTLGGRSGFAEGAGTFIRM